MSFLRFVCVLVLGSAAFASADQAPFDSAVFNRGDQPLELLRISPSGADVPPGRQIVFQFNRPVVPVGRMERRPDEIPITIEPNLDCEWRWLNPASLACQLSVETALLPATRYRIEVRPGITTADGASLDAVVSHTFITQRPRLLYPRFHTWQAPSLPHIIVQFDQDVDSGSVSRHLFLELEDGLRVPVVVEEDPNIVTARKRQQEKEIKPHSEDPDIVGVVTEGSRRLVISGERPNDQDKLAYARRSWLVYPETGLPIDAHVKLRVEPGIRAAAGPELGVENRVVVAFDTFPKFEFLGVRCTTNADKRMIVSPSDTPETQRCDPLGWTELLFSAPVSKEAVTRTSVISPDLAGGRTDYDPWANVHVYAGLSRPHRKDDPYSVSLPRGLKAHALYTLAAQADAVRDVFGRPLAENIDMAFATDHRRPLFHLQHKLSVLERDVETHLPVVVTNLESVHLDFQTLTSQGVTTRSSAILDIPRIDDVGFRYPLKVRDLLDGRSGAVQSTWRTHPVAPDWDHQTPYWFFSQVTPYHVHVKLGHYNSLVWVTRLDTGEPVDGAEVGVYVDTFGSFTEGHAFIAHAITTADGVASLPGSVELDPELTHLSTYRRRKPHLFIQVQKGSDMALLPLSHGFRADAWGPNRTYMPARLKQPYGHLRSWGFTAQGVYKAGDSVQFKLYVRDQDNRRYIAPPRAGYKLEVFDPTNKAVHVTETLNLSEFGAYDGEFTVPESGAVGWYRFVLSASFNDQKWEPLRVLISDFTPAPFRVITDLNGERFHPGDILSVSTQAKLHSGGPYGNTQTRLTVAAQSTPLIPSDPRAKGFHFDVQVPGPSSQTVHQAENAANDQGELETDFSLPEINVLYGRLMVESAVRDDRGKYVVGRARARYVGRDRYVGIHQPDWLLTSETPATVQTLVVNETGVVVDGTAIEVKVEVRATKAARVKGAGNAYLTRYVHDWELVAECQRISRREPAGCEFTPKQGGLYRMTATIKDTLGRAHSSALRRWATGPGQVLWETRPGFALQIVPDKNAYQVGETARFMVQNPFPGAQALVTTERFGVQQYWTTTLKTSSEVIEVPVEADALPGFYVSVLVMSPRVAKPLATDQVDLGKPAFRMGYVRVPVKDSSKEITVRVTPRAQVYKPRSRVTIDLQANTAAGATPPMEFAVVVLDEAVFDLISAGRAYYDPYEGFYRLEALDLRNFNLLKQLIGIQKFENKGADAGGGGGSDLTLRSVFKFVSYWNPTIKPNADGKATISFEVPDNLTGWRVLALAVTHDDLMGLGDGSFQVNQETEIRPALPNQVTAGDRFEARFTVMNRTELTRTLDVMIKAAGALDGGPVSKHLQVTTEPYKRHAVGIPLKAGARGEIVLSVRAQDAHDGDLLVLPLTVQRLQALEAAATYGTSTSDEVSESIRFPSDIRTDVGRVSVVASPSVVGGLEGAFEYLRDYPYTCWEQVLTKGVMAAHYLNLKAYLTDTLTWPEAARLPEETLKSATNYQAPNGGMVYYSPQDRYADPYLSAYTAIAMNWLRRSGYAIPRHVEDKLHDYLYQLLRQDVVPSFYTDGMSSTVRAVALAALAPHGKLTRNDVLRYRSHVKAMSLFGKAHYLMALIRVGDTNAAQDEVIDMIRSHANETGGKFVFVEALDFAYKRILDSSLRTNCAVLSALLEHEDRHRDDTQSSDVAFKLMHSITQGRQQRDRWENTQENMFCMNSVTNYSRVYEEEKPNMTVQAFLDMESMGEVVFKDHQDPPRDFVRPIRPTDPGRQATVRLQREGLGRYYYAARLFYSPAKLKQTAINAGIEVQREFSVERDGEWRLLERPLKIKIGELVRVDLYVRLPSARNFVVVDDPVPGGFEPVSRDLATASSVDADKGAFAAAGGSYWHRHADWREYGVSFWSFYHKELRHHAARFYSEYLPAGNYHLAYTAQAIAPGEFAVMPVHAEEMYNPDTFGQGVPAILSVEASE